MSLNYLKDTESNAVTNSIVPLIEGQFPEFVREEGSQFINFVEAYYKWLEASELTIHSTVQNEYRLTLEDDDTNIALEDGNTLTLESTRETSNTSSLSSFEKGEKITGQTSGAIGIVDRGMTTSNTKIFVTGLERTKFVVGETILGENNRTTATISSYFKNPLFASKSLLSQRDIDVADDIALSLIKKELAISAHETLEIDKRYFLKHVYDLYRSKGSEYSYDLFFKMFFNVQDLDFYRPKVDLLKPSSGSYTKENVLRIITGDTNDKFESRRITGQTSSATAIVDRVENFVSGALIITELFLIDIVGAFVVGENISSSEFEGTTGSGTTQGVLTDILISSAGTNYKVGDSLTITGGGGIDAAARVSQIGTGAITGFTIYDGGDGYINTTALTVNNFATGGTGVSGDISDIAHTFTFSVNDDVIGNFTTTLINDTDGYDLSGNTEAIRTDRLIDALGFSALQIGTISNVKATGLGSGYELSPIITVVQDNIAKFNDQSVGIINLNPDPDDVAVTNAITGTFTTNERITSNNGNKVGTFLGVVSDASTISDPQRFRARTIEYQGTFGSGRNDLTVNISSYINSTIPTVYDIQLEAPTFTGTQENTNKFIFRRGVNAASATESTNTDTTIEYTATGTTITGAFQKLQFPITSITHDGSSTSTVTTPKKHGLDDGQKVILSSSTTSDFNGEKTITVTGPTTFTFALGGSGFAADSSGNPVYDENVSIKFTLPFGHKVDDRFLVSTVEFDSNEIITGFDSSASAKVNTGTAIASGGIRGNNAVVDVAGLAAGSIKEIEIINFGVGYTSAPTLSLLDKGGGNANVSAKIGAIGATTGRYINEDGRPSSTKKLIDSRYYQDYSYSLRTSKQTNEYEDTVNKLLHPAGSKLFGEFKPPSPSLQMGFDHLLTSESGDHLVLEDGDSILMEQYYDPSHSIIMDKLQTITEGGTGGLVTITGNSNLIVADVGLTDELSLEDGSGVLILETYDNFLLQTATVSTDFPDNFPEGSKIIIDDEQAFEISYGDLLLEKTLSGTINCSSANVLSYLTLSNSSVDFTIGETYFQADTDVLILNSDNGVNSDSIIDYHMSLETTKLSISSITRSGTTATVTTPVAHGLIDGQKVTIEGANQTDYNGEKTITILTGNTSHTTFTFTCEDHTATPATGTIIYENPLFTDGEFIYEDGGLLVLESTIDPLLVESNGQILLESSTSSLSDTLFLEVQNNIATGIVSEYYTNSLNVKTLVLHTTVNNFNMTSNANGATSGATSSITSFDKNLIIGVGTDFEGELSINDVITLQGGTEKMQVMSILNSTAIICNTTIGDGNTTKFDNDVLNSMVLESTVRGTTSANGLNTGNTTLQGVNSFFMEDFLVTDVISLSSNTDLKAQVVSIADNTTLVTNTVLGDGQSDVSIVNHTLRNLNLEPSELNITLSGKYSGANNFMGYTDATGVGSVQLEDGIGLLNVLYTTSNSSAGKLQFEETSTFSNVEPKLIISS